MFRIIPLPIIATCALLLTLACGGATAPTDSETRERAVEELTTDLRQRFAGAWSLARIERRGADGELLAEPIEDRLGYIMYDDSGHMGVTIMRTGRKPACR